MSNIIGIDVSKDTLDCCLIVGKEPYYHTFNNDAVGFFELLTLYSNFKVVSLGFEYTGNYHKKLERYLSDNGVKPYLIKPIAISNFRKVLSTKGKTDKIDSFVISQYLLHGDLRDYLSYPTRELFKPLLSSIVLLDKQIRQTKNAIHAIELYPEACSVLDDLDKTQKYLTTTKNKIEKNTLELLYTLCPESKNVKDDIAGVGDKLILFVIPHIYDHFDKFTLKQINAFFGLNPISFQSGTSVYKRDKLSKRGDAHTLKMLYMASVSAVRNNPILKEKYLRLKANGKVSKVALVSVMAHLLRAMVIKLSHYTKREYKK